MLSIWDPDFFCLHGDKNLLSFHPLQVVKEEPGGKEEVTLENEVSDQGCFTVYWFMSILNYEHFSYHTTIFSNLMFMRVYT